MVNPHSYRFFHRESNDYYLLAANEVKGFYFTKDGGCYNKRGLEEHNIRNRIQKFKEKSLEETLITLRNKEARNNFLSILNIIPAQIIELKEEDINRVVDKLKNFRAFNGDSAHTFNKNEETADLLYSLTEKKLINSLDGQKYYLENE